MKRLLLAALLVAGCGGSAASTPPPAPTAAPTTAPSVTITPQPPTKRTFAPQASIDPAICENAIDIGDTLEDVLYQWGAALVADDTANMDLIVKTTADLAADVASTLDGRQARVVNWRTALEALDDSRLPYLQGDSEPFIEALGNAAIVGQSFRGGC